MLSYYLSTAAALVGAASAVTGKAPKGLDPIENMCMRFDHQSTIKDDILYIDGGVGTFVGQNKGGWANGSVTVGPNEYVIRVNMTQSWDWHKNITQSFVNKTDNPQTGTAPPQVVRAGLFSGPQSDSKIYLYGGTTSYLNQSFPGWQQPGSDLYTLWSYDTKTTDWDQYDVSFTTPERPNSGASAEAPELGLAFYYNGQVDNGTSLKTQNLGNTDLYVPGMVVLDLHKQTTRNVSTADATSAAPQSRAKMVYIPGIGEKGVLVAVGGAYKQQATFDTDDMESLVSLSSVSIFDVASLDNDGAGAWYQQNTTGDVPTSRVDHCLTVSSAADNSSHQIFMYGGRSSATEGIDDVWALSVPQFQWTKLNQGKSPRFGHTCHMVGKGKRQMLTVGGTTNTLDNLQKSCDWEEKGVAILDVSDVIWGSVYNAFAPAYEVPQPVYQQIGGGGNGGATMKSPKGGFSSQSLAAVFGSNSVSGSTQPPPSSHLPGGAIAGIVIGTLACLGIIAAGVWVRFFRHRGPRGRPTISYPRSTPDRVAEMAGHEVLEKDAGGPWSARSSSATGGATGTTGSHSAAVYGGGYGGSTAVNSSGEGTYGYHQHQQMSDAQRLSIQKSSMFVAELQSPSEASTAGSHGAPHSAGYYNQHQHQQQQQFYQQPAPAYFSGRRVAELPQEPSELP